MAELAKVTSDLDRPRGPDVEYSIHVPRSWLDGATLDVDLPRKLGCAHCHGGGCDACGRSGAVVLRSPEEPVDSVRVSLPALAEAEADAPHLVVRVPGAGGRVADEALGAGHLLLHVQATDEAHGVTLGVTRVPVTTHSLSDADRARLIRRSLVMAALLCLTFIGLLRLSGWL